MIQTLSFIVTLLGASMIFPAMADFVTGNPDSIVFASSALFVIFFGGLMFFATRQETVAFSRRDIFLFVPAVWLLSCIATAMPFYLSSLEISFADAFFEAASGLTTTGSTILTNLENMPPGILLWRSMSQWIGGLGIVVISISLLPYMKSGGQQLFSLESSDKSDKPFAQTRKYTAAIFMVYVALTTGCATVYMVLGMTPFEAINHAMTTVSTGGFSTSDYSMGAFATRPMLIASSVFMLIGGLPFIYLIRFISGHHVRDVQVSWYLVITLAATVTVFVFSLHHGGEFDLDFLISCLFHVVSIITTTGYAAEDYLLWGPTATVVFFFLTFIGGCAGSTAGGFKQFRLVIIGEVIVDTLAKTFRPNQVRSIRYGPRVVEDRLLMSVMVFSFLYAGTFIVFAAIYGVLGVDFETATSASATALANVGPGIGTVVGPAGNFKELSDAVKWMLSWEMIVGRLEIMSVYVLLLPSFWK